MTFAPTHFVRWLRPAGFRHVASLLRLDANGHESYPPGSCVCNDQFPRQVSTNGIVEVLHPCLVGHEEHQTVAEEARTVATRFKQRLAATSAELVPSFV